jgi:hypothetical protein
VAAIIARAEAGDADATALRDFDEFYLSRTMDFLQSCQADAVFNGSETVAGCKPQRLAVCGAAELAVTF